MERIKVGEKYGRLTVLENHHPKDEVVCKCDCGNIKISRASNVYFGGTNSCGCLKNEGNNKRHGERYTRLYGIWKGIKERCNTPSNTAYKNYGARGITYCKEWEEYLVFKEWALSHGYTDELTIDRIDVNGDYCPENCRWATPKEQANNTRHNRYLTYKGKTQSIALWSDELGIPKATIQSRLRRGHSVEVALSKLSIKELKNADSRR